jgi:hypothetical protein
MFRTLKVKQNIFEKGSSVKKNHYEIWLPVLYPKINIIHIHTLGWSTIKIFSNFKQIKFE